ncbi:MAG: tRNA threonylcarbamoyladenosine dehydratase [Clostridia bacterium]|nr:tRNA threonylcarbamoyladenosine dehydratase [Clostridia bacterium]
MEHPLTRTEALLGPENMAKLKGARVAVFGLGGVGGHAVEALARSGVGALDLIDKDTVSLTNLNRQLIATYSTLGMLKTAAMRERIFSFAPECRVQEWPLFFLPETAGELDFCQYNYVVDAIDTVSGKLSIIEAAAAAGVPVISCMGTGNKLDPSLLKVDYIENTSVCPLARVMRRELRKRGLQCIKVVYSTEPPLSPGPLPEDPHRRSTPGSTAFVPASAGLLLASQVVRDIIAAPV